MMHPVVSSKKKVQILSDFQPWCGQKNRSSENFKVPSNGEYVISAPDGFSFEIWHDIRAWPDTNKGRYKGGDTVYLYREWSLIPYNYYIANPKVPKDFNDWFEVTFIKKS
jgi:hypothetical protein